MADKTIADIDMEGLAHSLNAHFHGIKKMGFVLAVVGDVNGEDKVRVLGSVADSTVYPKMLRDLADDLDGQLDNVKMTEFKPGMAC